MTAAVTPASAPAGAPATVRRDLRLFLTGQMTSVFGNVLTGSALSMVAVLFLNAGPGTVALITGAGLLPVLLGPLAGVLLDRVRRPRRGLLAVDLASAAAAAGCALAWYTGVLHVWWLIGLNAILGCGTVAVEGLYFPHLAGLGTDNLAKARGSLQSGEMLARAAGGSAAGPLAAALGAPLLFVGDAVSYLVNAGCLLNLAAPDQRAQPPRQRRSLRAEFSDGVTAIRAHRVLNTYLLFVLFNGVASGGIAVQRPVFLLDGLDLPVALFTVPAVAATLCAVVGSRMAPRLLDRGVPSGRLLLFAAPAAAVSAGLLPMAAGATAWVLTAACAAAGLAQLFAAVTNIALVPILCDEIGQQYFGRATTLLASIAAFAGLAGTALGGALGDAVGTRAGIWICVAIGIAGGAVCVAGLRPGNRAAAGRPESRTAGTAEPGASTAPVGAGREAGSR